MKQKSKEGFSLVEMLIALAASSIVMLAFHDDPWDFVHLL